MELEKRAHDPHYGRRIIYIQKLQRKKYEKIQVLYKEGIQEIGKLTKRDLFIAGVNLYWAEGFKKDNLVGFSNSDPNMILLFIRWLTQCCDITKDRIKYRLGVNESYIDKIKDIESYWKHILNEQGLQFQKPYFQKVKWKKIYDNPDEYHGVIRIRVTKSTDLLRKIHGWINGLKLNSKIN
ncbi:hypothetical protein A2154_02205 [Candidatus Gottesmanbacteria bacterium RBG_16_43_7]|uniref:Uncharacterized protein n=1 Tax=Candidatus Gottesmanbacteria bacterium RBG_16_43_7 TaxID=1798373 RepID=A0A1F5Z9S2_9BACT|nr:MAG: hypothetical protein A2154_02205 [Candidatus Gottesmanbacteria bacterium RBG_16_43_7]